MVSIPIPNPTIAKPANPRASHGQGGRTHRAAGGAGFVNDGGSQLRRSHSRACTLASSITDAY